MYLLDTNVISELARARPHGAVTEWLSGVATEQLFVAAVTLGELQAGIEITRRQDEAKGLTLERWTDRIEASMAVLPVDGPAFRLWASFMAKAPKQLELDALIAAVAARHRLTVVTRNVRDFVRFDVPLLNPFQSTRPGRGR